MNPAERALYEAELKVAARKEGRERALHEYQQACIAVEGNGSRMAFVKGRTFLWGVEPAGGGREGGMHEKVRSTGSIEGLFGSSVGSLSSLEGGGGGMEGGLVGGGGGGGRRGRAVFNDW